MRLPRPYIPLNVRIQVAERQYKAAGWVLTSAPCRRWLDVMLKRLFNGQKVELHHRPALCNRVFLRNGKDGVFIGYNPAANNPDYLVYVPKDEHDIETRVRGQHGQHSDLALARKRKRKERKAKRRKTRWPSRPLRSANRWPKKGKRRHVHRMRG